MIGQEELVKQLNQYTLTTLPHSILLVGEGGCGKSSFIELVSKTFNLEVEDLTKNITGDDYIDMCLNINKRAYTVDCDKMNNPYKLLKILEEASLNAYFILYTVDDNYVATTIKDRCVKFKFKPYKYTELKQFSPADLDFDAAYKIAKTPGQLLKLNNEKIKAILDLTSNIINNIGKANFANALSISRKFNYKVEDYEGIDIDLFLNGLEVAAINSPIMNSIIKFKADLLNPRYDKRYIMDLFIMDMWEQMYESN